MRLPGEGDALGGVRVGAVHQLEVQVRFGGVAGVPALGELLPGADRSPAGDLERAAPDVGVQGVRPVAQVEHDVVAEDRRAPAMSRTAPSTSRGRAARAGSCG